MIIKAASNPAVPPPWPVVGDVHLHHGAEHAVLHLILGSELLPDEVEVDDSNNVLT